MLSPDKISTSHNPLAKVLDQNSKGCKKIVWDWGWEWQPDTLLTRQQYFPDTIGQLLLWIHSSHDSIIKTFPSWRKSNYVEWRLNSSSHLDIRLGIARIAAGRGSRRFRIWALVWQPYFSGWPQKQEYIKTINWIWWLFEIGLIRT